MCEDAPRAPADPPTKLATALLLRLPTLTDGLVDRIRHNMREYRPDGPVPAHDLYESCRYNLEFMLRHVAREASLVLDAPRQTGRRRAEQGVPLSLVQRAFRLGFSYLWELLVTEAQKSGAATDGDLVAMASEVWTHHETFTTAMVNAFNETTAVLMLRREQERSALVEALLLGGSGGAESIINAADLLAFPYNGAFAVVVADSPGLARHALPDIEPMLRARDIGSAWRLTPDLHIGIVSMGTAGGTDRLLETLRAQSTGRVGVSPTYTRLEQTPHALHLARIALASTATGSTAVTPFDDSPLPMLVVSAPATVSKISRQILGAVLELPEHDREVLLTTMTTYFEVDGSAGEAAKRLYCHPNTVRYRLRRIEQLTGRFFERRIDSAELYIALQAVFRVPDVMRDPFA